MVVDNTYFFSYCCSTAPALYWCCRETIALSSWAAWKLSLQIALGLHNRLFHKHAGVDRRQLRKWGCLKPRCKDLLLVWSSMCFRCLLSASPGQHPHSCTQFSVCIVSLQGPESNRFKCNGWKGVLALLGPWPGCSWAKGSKAREAK